MKHSDQSILTLLKELGQPFTFANGKVLQLAVHLWLYHRYMAAQATWQSANAVHRCYQEREREREWRGYRKYQSLTHPLIPVEQSVRMGFPLHRLSLMPVLPNGELGMKSCYRHPSGQAVCGGKDVLWPLIAGQLPTMAC